MQQFFAGWRGGVPITDRMDGMAGLTSPWMRQWAAAGSRCADGRGVSFGVIHLAVCVIPAALACSNHYAAGGL